MAKLIFDDNPFYKIPRSVLLDKNLSNNAKILLAILLSFSYNENFEYKYNGDTCVGNKKLSELLNVSERQVSRLIKELKENEYITIFVERTNDAKMFGNLRYIFINEEKLSIIHNQELD